MKTDPELNAFLNNPGDEVISKDSANDEESLGDVPHPCESFFQAAQLGAGAGFQREVAVLDRRASGIYKAIASEAAKQTPAARSKTDFAENSEQRFAKARQVIERIFAGHPEECAEAIATARRMMAEERAAAILDAA